MTEIEKFVVFFEVHKERAIESLTHMNVVTDQTIGKTEELKESLIGVRELIESPIQLSATEMGKPTIDEPTAEIPVEFKYEDPKQKPPVKLPYIPDIEEPSRVPTTILPIEDMELRARGIDERELTPTTATREDISSQTTPSTDVPITQRDKIKDRIEQAKSTLDRQLEMRTQAVNNITQQVDNIQNLTLSNRNDIRRQSVQQMSQNITENEAVMQGELPDKPEEAIPQIRDIAEDQEIQPTPLTDTSELDTEDIAREIEELQRAVDQLRADITTPSIEQSQLDRPEVPQDNIPEIQTMLKRDVAQRDDADDLQPAIENVIERLIQVSTDASIQDRRNVIKMLNQALEMRTQVSIDNKIAEGDDITQVTNRVDQRSQQQISYPLIEQTSEIIQTQTEINIINDVVMALQDMSFPGLNINAEIDTRNEAEIIQEKVRTGIDNFYEREL